MEDVRVHFESVWTHLLRNKGELRTGSISTRLKTLTLIEKDQGWGRNKTQKVQTYRFKFSYDFELFHPSQRLKKKPDYSPFLLSDGFVRQEIAFWHLSIMSPFIWEKRKKKWGSHLELASSSQQHLINMLVECPRDGNFPSRDGKRLCPVPTGNFSRELRDKIRALIMVKSFILFAETFKGFWLIWSNTIERTADLERLYQALLTIAPTSVSSEHEFSIAGNYLTSKRDRLSF